MGLEEARREFWMAWGSLSDVHTQEALDAQSEKMWAARKRLLKVDPEFRAMLKDREDKANAEAEESKKQIQSKHKAIVSEAEAESQTIISATNAKVNVAMRMSDKDLDEWVQSHRLKIRTPEEAEAKSKTKLICPICSGKDSGNLLNSKPACFECMHILVPESEIKNYNRAYRRRWKKKSK